MSLVLVSRGAAWGDEASDAAGAGEEARPCASALLAPAGGGGVAVLALRRRGGVAAHIRCAAAAAGGGGGGAVVTEVTLGEGRGGGGTAVAGVGGGHFAVGDAAGWLTVVDAHRGAAALAVELREGCAVRAIAVGAREGDGGGGDDTALWVLFEDGALLCVQWRAVLARIAAAAAAPAATGGGGAPPPPPPPRLPFRKWILDGQGATRAIAVLVGPPPSGPCARPAGAVTALLAVGAHPAVARFEVPHEGDGGGGVSLGDIAAAVASRVTSAVSSAVFSFVKGWGWGGGGGGGASGGSDTGAPATSGAAAGGGEPPVSARAWEESMDAAHMPRAVDAAGAFEDPSRTVCAAALAPGGGLLAACDASGRVLLFDASDVLPLRVWKGYREAAIAWIVDAGGEGAGVHSRGGGAGLYLAILAPRRRVLELWRAPHGSRVAAVALPGGAARALWGVDGRAFLALGPAPRGGDGDAYSGVPAAADGALYEVVLDAAARGAAARYVRSCMSQAEGAVAARAAAAALRGDAAEAASALGGISGAAGLAAVLDAALHPSCALPPGAAGSLCAAVAARSGRGGAGDAELAAAAAAAALAFAALEELLTAAAAAAPSGDEEEPPRIGGRGGALLESPLGVEATAWLGALPPGAAGSPGGSDDEAAGALPSAQGFVTAFRACSGGGGGGVCCEPRPDLSAAATRAVARRMFGPLLGGPLQFEVRPPPAPCARMRSQTHAGPGADGAARGRASGSAPRGAAAPLRRVVLRRARARAARDARGPRRVGNAALRGHVQQRRWRRAMPYRWRRRRRRRG